MPDEIKTDRREYHRKWRVTNIEKRKADAKAWRKANRVNITESNRQWNLKNPFRCLASQAAKRQLKRGLTLQRPSYTDIEIIWNTCGGRCTICEQEIVLHSEGGCYAIDQAHLDAIVPSDGYTLTNMTFLCAPCNRMKYNHVLSTAKRLYEFLLEHHAIS